MCKDFKLSAKQYNEISIPKELFTMTNETINASIKFRKHTKRLLTSVAVFIMMIGLFVTGLNTSQAFASSINNIPLLNHIASLITFVEYENDTPSSHNDVSIPSIIYPSSTDEPLSDTVSEKLIDINQTILTRVDAFIEEANKRAQEDKEAYVETGGDPDDFIAEEITVDYTILHQSENTLSFLVSMSQTQAYSYVEPLYYTIDLHTGDEVTLADLLGDNYESHINHYVQSVIEEDLATNPHSMYFSDNLGFNGIKPDQPFFLNEEGSVVIHFDKYEIAAGAAGPIDIEIPQ